MDESFGLERLPSRRVAPWWSCVVALVAFWHGRAAERRVLAALGARELSDIGIARADALSESAKPF